MGSILKRERGGHVVYLARVTRAGKTESKQFTRQTDAKRWISEQEIAHERREAFGEVDKTVSDMIERYIADVVPDKGRNGQWQIPMLQEWDEHLGKVQLAKLRPSMIREAREKIARRETQYGSTRGPATVNRFMAVFSHALTMALRWEWIDRHPVRHGAIERLSERPRRRYLSDDERARLLEACRAQNPHLYPMVMLAIYTGMRRDEIRWLTWGQVDLGERVILLREDTTKNGDPRVVPLAKPVVSLLREKLTCACLPGSLLFPGDIPGTPFDPRKAWEAARKEAGLEDVHFHDLRHCTGSYLTMAGVDQRTIGEILGHRTAEMTRRYSHLDTAHMQRAIDKMAESLEEET